MNTFNKNIISHGSLKPFDDAEYQKIVEKIKAQGDKPHVTVEKQLQLLAELAQSEFGRFLLQNRGVNGYWTHYFLTHPWFGRHQKKLVGIEKFLLDESPSILATQQRFEIFLREIQKKLKPGSTLCSIPCGLLGELLYLNFDGVSDYTLVGIDLDEEALAQAKVLAEKKEQLKHVQFIQAGAWDIQLQNMFDLVSSNGLNIYEPDDQRVMALYQRYFEALKPGGKLVTSFLTFPVGLTENCEWDMSKIDPNALLTERIIFSDIIEVKWRCFRSTEQTHQQLASVGFKNIQFIYDHAKIFPTVIAFKE